MMSLSGKFKIVLRHNGETHEIPYSLSAEEVETLSEFLKEVDSLEELPLVQAGVPASYSISWKAGEGGSLSFSLPPLGDLAAFLHRLRPLILTNEPFSFDRVCGIIGKRLGSPFIRQLLKKQREVYSGKLMQSQVEIISQGVLLNSEGTLMNWLNSHEYHRDKGKAAELDRLHQMFPLDSSKSIFVMLLSHKLDALYAIANLVELALGKRSKLEVNLHQLPKADAEP